MTRFQIRRRLLARLHRCTRCGSPSDKSKWCTACLAVDAAKRDTGEPAQRRQQRKEARRALYTTALLSL